MGSERQTRREFCTRTCSAAAVAVVGGVLQACGGGGSPTSPGGGGNAASLPALNGSVSGRSVTVGVGSGSPLAATGSSALVRSSIGDFLVARTSADAFVALTAVCTHENCTITGVSGPAFVCPCHGSRFDQSGGVISGPARTSLRQFGTQLASDVLTINA
jgi:Rieske Fe-S protein